MSIPKLPVAIAGFWLVFSFAAGCGFFTSETEEAGNDRAITGSELTPGTVRVSFEVNFFPVQKTLWIEDDEGNYIRSLHVSQWMVEEGEQYNVLPDWLEASRPARREKTQPQIDAYTAATLQAGRKAVFDWDLTDWRGQRVDRGTYRFILQCDGAEGVVISWKAELEIDTEPVTAEALPRPPVHPEGLEMYVEEVRVEFRPGRE